jgi:hypothetical protein
MRNSLADGNKQAPRRNGTPAVELYLKGFLRLSVQANRRTTFCEPADEVLPAHHNGDTAGPLEKKLLGRHQPGRLMATAESRCHHYYCASLREQGFGLRD